jgi:hypothetical protein
VLSVCVFQSKSHTTLLELKSFTARPQEKNFEILMVFCPKFPFGRMEINRETGLQTPSLSAIRRVLRLAVCRTVTGLDKAGYFSTIRCGFVQH